jgi:hypothetical protein
VWTVSDSDWLTHVLGHGREALANLDVIFCRHWSHVRRLVDGVSTVQVERMNE